MSRHGRPRQPRLGGTAGDGAVPAPGEDTDPQRLPGAPDGPGDRPTAGSTDPGAAGAPGTGAPRAGRVRVNDGTKVTPLADDDDLEEVPAAGGRFSAWRRHRQERAASRTLTASRVPPADEPPRAGSTAVGATSAGPTSAGPTSAGPTSAGSTSAGPTAAGSTAAGSTAAGSTAVGATAVGATAVGATAVGATTAGATTAGATVVAFPASPGARRRRRRIGAVLGVLAALAVLAGVLFLSPALAVREISVRGAELTDPARVESALEAYRGVPLTRISKDEVRDRVGRIPQVRSIEVLLEPPHHLVVALHERVPVAAVEDGDEFVVVDSEGVELMTAGSAEEAGVPVVTGGRDVLESERFDAIADVLAALPESVLAQLRTASAESLSSVELAFTDGRTVVWGTAEDSELKSQVLRELVEARGAGSGVETYDVSSPTRPVVR
ncbi:FtsQ-type POTRA domain-containing protein [Kocuria sp. CPCC 205292]|uniref:cell division protein FtsQ/DivIB n=1 Tax=Kocuria cellulosilytica TaxID=3071451 RepID=UPI0034D56DDF